MAQAATPPQKATNVLKSEQPGSVAKTIKQLLSETGPESIFFGVLEHVQAELRNHLEALKLAPPERGELMTLVNMTLEELEAQRNSEGDVVLEHPRGERFALALSVLEQLVEEVHPDLPRVPLRYR